MAAVEELGGPAGLAVLARRRQQRGRPVVRGSQAASRVDSSPPGWVPQAHPGHRRPAFLWRLASMMSQPTWSIATGSVAKNSDLCRQVPQVRFQLPGPPS